MLPTSWKKINTVFCMLSLHEICGKETSKRGRVSVALRLFRLTNYFIGSDDIL
jgi:hypothetical protein